MRVLWEWKNKTVDNCVYFAEQWWETPWFWIIWLREECTKMAVVGKVITLTLIGLRSHTYTHTHTQHIVAGQRTPNIHCKNSICLDSPKIFSCKSVLVWGCFQQLFREYHIFETRLTEGWDWEKKKRKYKSVCYMSTKDSTMDGSVQRRVMLLIFQSQQAHWLLPKCVWIVGNPLISP